MLRIAEEPSFSAEETRQIYAGLLLADPAGAPRQFASLTLSLRDTSDLLVGALLGSTAWNHLSIDVLWVAEGLRKRGYGAMLMKRAEWIAAQRGCTRARLDTFDFQARAFYERLGYTVYAQLDDFPPGHAHFHMHKTLTVLEP